MEYVKLNTENINAEHICCAIADKKHSKGVVCKKDWLKNQMKYNHTFYKLNQKGKVFIEYVDSEGAWVPIVAPNYIYIHCFWVSGSFKGKGHSTNLLKYCVDDAKARGKSGLCVLVGSKKTPFLSDKAYLLHCGFEVVDRIHNYELMALNFKESKTKPVFAECAKKNFIDKNGYVVYFTPQCPYSMNCILEMQQVAMERMISLTVIEVATLEQAQNMPCVFNNFALFKEGKFVTHHLLNRGYFEKIIDGKFCS